MTGVTIELPVPPEPDMATAALAAALTERGAAGLRHTGRRSFQHHLLGTWRILAAWGCRDDLRRAGLFHSCYGTDAFEPALFSQDERAAVRDLIGEDAEALVALYGRLDRADLLARLADIAALPKDSVTARDRAGASLTLPTALVRDLLTIELANVADQAVDIGGGPGLWLAWAAHLVRLIGAHGPPLPIFAGGTGTLTAGDEEQARTLYYEGAVTLAVDAGVGASQLAEVTRLNPWVAEPRLLLAGAAIDAGRRDEALHHLRAAAACFRAWGTAWDKRRTYTGWLTLAGRMRDALAA